LFSTLPNSSSGDFTVTRATTATRVNAAGLVELVPYNLLQRSEEFDLIWGKTRAAITANTATAPNGTLTADTLTGDGSLGGHNMNQALNFTSGLVYTFSIYAKKDTNDIIQMSGATTIFGSFFINFDLNSGTIGSSADVINSDIIDVGDGWYRCSATVSAILTTSGVIGIWLVSSNTSTKTEANSLNTSVYLWGAQLVEGTDPLPYQPTTTRLNISRADYSQGGCPNILLEPQRTNLILASEQFDSGSWNKAGVSITPNQAVSPSGTNTMDLITFPSSALSVLQQVAVTSGSIYTFSIWLATQSGTQTIEIGNINVGVFQTITITTTPTRYEITQVASAATRFPGIRSTGVYSIYAWGAQLEAGAYATTYIPTTSATVTRNADVISRSNIYTNNRITSAGGTWFVDLRNNIARIRETSNNGLFLNTGFNSVIGDGFTLRNTGGVIRIVLQKIVASTINTLFATTTESAKIAIKWNGTTADVFVNGVKVVDATAFTATAMENLIGNGGNVAFNINSMALHPFPLSDADCIELTTL
jgi:hypothetical protein